MSATATATTMPTAQGTPRVWKYRQPREAQAENRSGNRQTGGQDNFGHAAVGGVVGRFPVLAGLTGLVIPADEKYPVICSSRDHESDQQIDGERREADNLVIAEERDDSPGHLQFDPHHQQQRIR